MKRIFSAELQKSSYIKFNKNPSTGTLAVPCGKTDKTNLIVALFLQFVEKVTTGSGAHADYAVTPDSRGANLTAHLYLPPELSTSGAPCIWSPHM